MSDIVERLREIADEFQLYCWALDGKRETINAHKQAKDIYEAADRIEQDAVEIERMQAIIKAARKWRDSWQWYCGALPRRPFEDMRHCYELAEALDAYDAAQSGRDADEKGEGE